MLYLDQDSLEHGPVRKDCQDVNLSHIFTRNYNTDMFSISPFKPSGRSGKMRALSFKTGIACLCGTEVKEKLQCEYNSCLCSDVGGGRGVAGGERREAVG